MQGAARYLQLWRLPTGTGIWLLVPLCAVNFHLLTASAQVQFAINSQQGVTAISPYI